jgi:hypothetical protein
VISEERTQPGSAPFAFTGAIRESYSKWVPETKSAARPSLEDEAASHVHYNGEGR